MSKRERKAQNKLIREKQKLIQDMEKHPDWCYCEELLNLDSDVDFEYDEIIGTTEPVDIAPYLIGHTSNLYKCKRCNKKTTMKIMFA